MKRKKESARPPTEPMAGASSAAPAPSFVRWTAQGCTLDVAVVPNAKRTQADGLHDGALRVRLAALPVDGAANEALVRWLADTLAVPRRHIELLRGQTARRKTLAVQAERAAVEAWLRTLDLPPAA